MNRNEIKRIRIDRVLLLFHGLPDFYIYSDFMGFIPYCINENNTIGSLLKSEHALQYQMSQDEDDNPVIAILYLKQ